MKRAFSLLEMLIVMLIVTIVAAASAPMISKKMLNDAANDSPWIWTNNNSVAFNLKGNDNTPAVIHYEIALGDKVEITLAPKGFGSENMSRVFMLKPSDGIEGVKEAVLTAVNDAGPNACPPMVVGVGIGGTFEKCALLAKKALTRDFNEKPKEKYIADLEEELLCKINNSGIGPGGLGGMQTAFKVNIEAYPTHIAGLPVAINICCHVNRHVTRII